MQEEIENRTVNFAISTTKLTASVVIAGVRKLLAAHAGHKAKAEARREREEDRKAREQADRKPTGKQTVQELIGQNAGVTSIDIARTDLKGFEKYARTFIMAARKEEIEAMKTEIRQEDQKKGIFYVVADCPEGELTVVHVGEVYDGRNVLLPVGSM